MAKLDDPGLIKALLAGYLQDLFRDRSVLICLSRTDFDQETWPTIVVGNARANFDTDVLRTFDTKAGIGNAYPTEKDGEVPP